MRKTIGIDARCLPSDGSPGAGIAHATRFLIEALEKTPVPWEWRVFAVSEADLETGMDRVDLLSDRGASLRDALRGSPCDLLFVPSGSVPYGLAVPAVPWVHDMAIYSHPEWFPQSFLQRSFTTFLHGRGVRGAPHVCAVSDATKQEIVERFLVPAERVTVTWEGGDPELARLRGDVLQHEKNAARARLGEDGFLWPFMLVLGTVEPRKNVEELVSLWHNLPRGTKGDFHLVIAGSMGWRMQGFEEEMRDVSGKTADIHRMTDVDDGLRRDLLLAADAVVVPSLHEGFGLVALEAMQAGTALIASRVGALPEVVGEAGLLCRPGDDAEWTKALALFCSSREALRHFGQAGKDRSSLFSWEHAAERVCGALDAALHGQPVAAGTVRLPER